MSNSGPTYYRVKRLTKGATATNTINVYRRLKVESGLAVGEPPSLKTHVDTESGLPKRIVATLESHTPVLQLASSIDIYKERRQFASTVDVDPASTRRVQSVADFDPLPRMEAKAEAPKVMHPGNITSSMQVRTKDAATLESTIRVRPGKRGTLEATASVEEPSTPRLRVEIQTEPPPLANLEAELSKGTPPSRMEAKVDASKVIHPGSITSSMRVRTKDTATLESAIRVRTKDISTLESTIPVRPDPDTARRE